MIDFDALEMIGKFEDILTEQQKRVLAGRAFANASELEKEAFATVIEIFRKINEMDKEEEKQNGMDF